MDQVRYAAHRGVSKQAVSYAVRDGRIPTVKVGARRLIDPAIADAAWAANTDQLKPRNSVTGDPMPGTGNGAARNGHALRQLAPVPGTLAHEQLLDRRVAREIREIERDRRAGRFVNAADVEAHTFKRVRAAQKALLSIPPRLPLTEEQRRLLTEELRRVCLMLAGEASAASAGDPAAPEQRAVASS